MANSGVLVSNTAITTFPYWTPSPWVYVMSDGYRVAIWGTTGGTYYALQTAAGAAWGAPVQFKTSNFFSQQSVPVNAWQAGDNIHLFSGGTVTILPYNATSHSMGSLLSGYLNPPSSLAQNPGTTQAATGGSAAYISSSGLVYAGYSDPTTSGGALSASFTLVDTGLTLSSGGPQQVIATSSYAYVLSLWPSTGWYLDIVSLVSPITATRESLGFDVARAVALSFDSSGYIDFVGYDLTTHNLITLKRLGAGSYSATTTLDSSGKAIGPPNLTYASGSGNLTVHYITTANQANGEVAVVQRANGYWTAPSIVNGAGNDATGYTAVTAVQAPDGSNTQDLLYVNGTSTYGLYSLNVPSGATPSAPTPGAPSGYIGTTSPTFNWTYNNPNSPTDVQSAYEIVVYQSSTLIWDSGKVVSGATSVPYGGSALANGTQYTWQVRTWDTVLNSASAYSTSTAFTPEPPPSVALNSIYDSVDGTITTFPATIQSPAIRVTGTPSGAVSSVNAYTVLLYSSDGSTLIDSVNGTLSPAVANGTAFTTATWTSGKIANLSTYKLAIRVQDSSTNLTGTSAQVQISTHYTPPGIVTNPTAAPVPDQGYVQLAWVNPSGAATITVLRSPAGTGVWTTLSSGSLISSLKDFPPLSTAFDYGIQAVGASGSVGTMALIRNVTLDGRYGRYYVWLNDISTNVAGVMANLLTNSVALGAVDDWDTGTGLDYNDDILEYVPIGRTRPITSFGRANYISVQGRQYWIPATDGDAIGSTTGSGTIALLQSSLRQRPLLYRDADGRWAVITIRKLHPLRKDGLHYTVKFDITESDTSLAAVVLTP